MLIHKLNQTIIVNNNNNGSREEGGRGLAMIEDSVDALILRLKDYLKKSD